MYIANKNSALTDGNRAKRLLLELVVGVLFFLVAVFSIKTGRFIIGSALVALPVLMKFLSAPNLLIMLSVISSFARFQVPGLKAVGGLDASLLLNMLFIAIYLTGSALGAFKKPELKAHNILLIIFGINLFVTAAYRGFGIYALGGNMIGGMNYIIIWVAIVFISLSSQFTLTKKQGHFLIYVCLIAPIITFLAQFIVFKSGGNLWMLSGFFAFETQRVAAALPSGLEGGSTMRYETLIDVGLMLIPLPFIFKPRNPFVRLMLWSVLPICMAIMFTTGFRRTMLGVAFVIFCCAFFLSKRKMTVVFVFGIFGALGIGIIYALAPSLSWNAQRAIAILPGVDVEASALHSAMSSNEWRMELYNYCFEEIPNYLLVGKGILLTLEEKLYQISLMTGGLGYTSSAYFNFMAHGYHSGILELLLDTGLLGFLSYTGFIIYFFSYVAQKIRKLGTDSLEGRFLVCLTVIALWKTIEIMLIRAGFFPYFSNFYAIAVVIILIINSIDQKQKADATIDEADEG